ncbi:MAG: hypothetical protein RBS07_13205 [Lentimicrobium sp.]|jgi:hypothetical protein|nr:hypothetical protein [Lentimicrobium sp.]
MKTFILTILLSLLTITQNWAHNDITKNKSTESKIKVDTLAIAADEDFFTPSPAEEEYINDFPLDTKSIVFEYFQTQMPKPTEEAMSYDFPYETKVIAERYMNKILPEIAPAPEPEFNDFPMNTAPIARRYLSYRNQSTGF